MRLVGRDPRMVPEGGGGGSVLPAAHCPPTSPHWIKYSYQTHINIKQQKQFWDSSLCFMKTRASVPECNRSSFPTNDLIWSLILSSCLIPRPWSLVHHPLRIISLILICYPNPWSWSWWERYWRQMIVCYRDQWSMVAGWIDLDSRISYHLHSNWTTLFRPWSPIISIKFSKLEV